MQSVNVHSKLTTKNLCINIVHLIRRIRMCENPGNFRIQLMYLSLFCRNVTVNGMKSWLISIMNLKGITSVMSSPERSLQLRSYS